MRYQHIGVSNLFIMKTSRAIRSGRGTNFEILKNGKIENSDKHVNYT